MLSQLDDLWKSYHSAMTKDDIPKAVTAALNAARFYENMEDVVQAGIWHREAYYATYLHDKRSRRVPDSGALTEARCPKYERAWLLISIARNQALELKLNDALITLGRSEEIAKSYREDTLLEAQIYGSKAFCFERSGDVDRAIVNYRQAAVLMQQTGQLRKAAGVLGKLAFCLIESKRAEEANQYLTEALKIIDQESHPRLQAALQNCLGYSYALLDQKVKAEQSLTSPIRIFELLCDPLQLAISLFCLSAFHDLIREYDAAANGAARALEVARKVGFEPLVVHARDRLLSIELKSKRPQGKLGSFYKLFYVSDKMRSLVAQAKSIAPLDETILLLGETGTGKDLVAHAVHQESKRKGSPFIAFNCSAISRELIEARLFGYRRGAFTGAGQDHEGIIRAANGGTLFLDEIGNLGLEAQGALLRFLQSSEIQPLGEVKPVKVNVRVIAATNCDLKEEVEAGRFRKDLFYRLNVITLYIPPLRARPEDLLALAKYYSGIYSAQYDLPSPIWTEAEQDWLVKYEWPGNVRELETYVKRRILLGLQMDELIDTTCQKEINSCGVNSSQATDQIEDPKRRGWRKLNRLEKERLLAEALANCAGNVSAAARELGISRRTIQKRRAALLNGAKS